jgi:cyclic-di-GMP phosphodiesterase TipF (flagellum assembly factor)
VLLEPIMGLEDNRARHYEVTVRLRAPTGDVLSTEDNRADIEGRRILPLVDAMKIVRTANVASRLGERGKDGAVFSDYAGESLADTGFLSEVRNAIAARPATAGQLVLSFSQTDVRGFEAPEWGALAGLEAVGFRFALSGVTDLDMDFEVLARCGFAFVKLDADVFLDGLMAPSGLVPASDVCRHLASQGLALVVDHIDSDYKRARIFGFGVLLGQGQLFGVPRPMRVDAVTGHRDAAA